MGVTLVLMDEYGQLYFVGVGVPLFALGYLAALVIRIEAVGGKFTYRLSRFSRKKLFSVATAVSAIGFIIVGISKSWYSLPFAFLPLLAYFFTYPLVLNDLHQELPSGQRATGESFVSLLRGLAFIPLSLVFSGVAERNSMTTAYLVIGMLVTLYLGVFLFTYRSHKPTKS